MWDDDVFFDDGGRVPLAIVDVPLAVVGVGVVAAGSFDVLTNESFPADVERASTSAFVLVGVVVLVGALSCWVGRA